MEKVQEAISYLEGLIRDTDLVIPACSPELRRKLEAQREYYELAVEALSQTLKKGDPLTLEQLREMKGEKVFIYRMKSTEPLEPGTVKQNGDVLGDSGTLAYHELYLETWVALSHYPGTIDHDKWKACELCQTCGNCEHNMGYECSQEMEMGKPNCGKFVPANNYCWKCGRPLTPEAWAKLEKRLRG